MNNKYIYIHIHTHVQRKLHVFPHFDCSASLRLPDVLSGLRQGPHMSLGPCVSESLRGHQMLWNTQAHLGDSSVDMWSKVTISRVGPFTLIWRLDTQTCPWLSEVWGIVDCATDFVPKHLQLHFFAESFISQIMQMSTTYKALQFGMATGLSGSPCARIDWITLVWWNPQPQARSPKRQ